MAAAATFMEPPELEALEWPGTTLGIANTVTQTRGPVPVERALKPDLAERLFQACRRTLEGPEAFIQDAVIHGVTIRLFSNLNHVADFWRDNWYGAREWRERTGRAAAAPRAAIWAIGGLKDWSTGVYARAGSDASFVVNCSHYAAVRTETIAVVARLLAEEQGIHAVRASAAGNTIHLGTGRSTAVFAAMKTPEAIFHSDDVVFVRYACRRKAGGWVAPVSTPGARGWRVFEWLDRNPGERKIPVHVLAETSVEPVELRLEDLDPADRRTLAYPCERAAYVRTDLVRLFPEHAWSMIRSKLENAPEPASADGEVSDSLVRAATDSSGPAARNFFSGLPPGRRRDLLRRLVAREETRALLDPRTTFGPTRVGRNPLRPLAVLTATVGRPQGAPSFMAGGAAWEGVWPLLKPHMLGAPEAEGALTRQLLRTVSVRERSSFAGEGA